MHHKRFYGDSFASVTKCPPVSFDVPKAAVEKRCMHFMSKEQGNQLPLTNYVNKMKFEIYTCCTWCHQTFDSFYGNWKRYWKDNIADAEVAVCNWNKNVPGTFIVDRMKKFIGCLEKMCSTK